MFSVGEIQLNFRAGSFDSTYTGRAISLIKVFQPVLVHGV